MFRRKDEGSDEMFKEAPTDVQIPPAPQVDETAATASANPSPYASTTGFAPASAPKPAATSGTSTGGGSAAGGMGTYRAPGTMGGGMMSGGMAGSNVTELSGRARFSDTNRTSGSNSMDKNTGKAGTKNRVLTVGNDILMKGEINSCDRIVIEGAVDATLKDVHTMEIAQSGSFKGVAEVEEAEISGLVEGDLSVRGRLIIYATGKVSGKISYGEIEIERGGQLTGEIKTVGVGAGYSSKEAA